MLIGDIIKQAEGGEAFSREQLEWMLALDPASQDCFRIMSLAAAISRELTGDRAEVHGQIALNLAPCVKNCLFCSFAKVNGVFPRSIQLSPREAVQGAVSLERDGANAVYVMTTADYSFGRFLETAREVRANLRPETVLVANVGDRTPQEARDMKDAGIDGVYHALRLREGKDTAIDPQKRLDSFKAFEEAGLGLGTCVEPIGPEHGNSEIAELIQITASLNPAYSGAARRISIPGTMMADKYGMIPELRQAQCVAVTRLGMPRTTKGNCTHEPCAIGAAAGANLLWAEVGANPRDTEERTEDGRGFDVKRCRQTLWEAGCGLLEGPSEYYG